MNETNDSGLQGNEVPPRATDGTGPAATTSGTSGTSAGDRGVSGTPTLSYLPTGRVLQRKNGMIGGVAGGLADYFMVDVTITRLVMILLTIVTSPALLVAYIIAWVIIPAEDTSQVGLSQPSSQAGSTNPPAPTT